MPILEPGTLIKDTYEVERFLGEGAFAEVYRVKHRFLGRQSLKIFKRVGMSIEEIHDVLGEALLLSRIGHPNIVRVFDANVLETETGTCGYFTMEYVAGGSLRRFWQSHGINLVPVATSLSLIKQVCEGLAVAHCSDPPIVHRDIKPENILVGYEADGLRARVSDFGLAKNVNPLTLLATTAGTIAFKPPEAFAAKQGDSCASDVWAIGATLYMLLTDKLPFAEALSTSITRHEHPVYRTLIPPSQVNPDVPSQLDEVIAKSLHRDQAKRYQTAQEMLSNLNSLRDTQPNVTYSKRQPTEAHQSKVALGSHSEPDEPGARVLVEKALKCGKSGELDEASDLMEEAFGKFPLLRAQFEDRVKLWRRGIAM